MPLFLLFVIVPLIEIALFVEIGGAIGLWPTLLIVLLTAIAGAWLMRRQGAVALADMQRAFAEFRDPTAPLAHGALIMLAGALLILPGFFTDTLGLLLLIPPVRSLLLRRMGRRVRVVSAGFSRPAPEPHRYRGGQVIDADYVDVDEAWTPPPPDGPRRPSGWTRPDVP